MTNQTISYEYSITLIPAEKNAFLDNEKLFMGVITCLKKCAASCRWHIDEIMHDENYIYLTIQLPLEVPLDEAIKILYEDEESQFSAQGFWSEDYDIRAIRKVF